MNKKPLRIAIVFFVVLLVLLAHFGGRMTAIETFTFAAEEKRVYLTFDDGPSTVVTNRILDTLKREGVKATFFIVGERVYGREETLSRIAEEGHSIGVHSMSHEYKKIYSDEEIFLRDVEDCAAVIYAVTGQHPTLYRFPGGGTHARERALLTERGYHIVDWNAVCGDGTDPYADAATLARTAAKTAEGKQCVTLLLHDSAPQKATASALPAIIDGFRRRGYVFCAL